jgi:hypothetical protein
MRCLALQVDQIIQLGYEVDGLISGAVCRWGAVLLTDSKSWYRIVSNGRQELSDWRRSAQGYRQFDCILICLELL